ncbi:ABC transporter, permease protein (cluster 3, basic aa/glutamine/opines) [Olavius sp. associated proteobacterium Delta 1]|nr:ABC transporter, permease protein (cluster 3, basic aa/glutamine/opines) [Olavius sp. associated proteobacterium Delta 1]
MQPNTPNHFDSKFMEIVPYTKNKNLWQKIHRSPLFDISQFILLVGAILWFFYNSTAELGYNWQWYQIPQYIFAHDETGYYAGPLWNGLMVTFRISGISLLLAFTIGLATALFRLSNSFVARIIARVYLEAIRNTPLLIQLFFIYFVMGPVLGISRMASAILALSLFEGAYASEIFRAGIVSIRRGQWEAAYSLGLNSFDTYYCVILPQAIRRILPPLTSQAISLIKDSALVSTIAIYDLTMQAQAVIAETFLTFELWFTVAGMYLAVTITLSFVVNWMENHFKVVT